MALRSLSDIFSNLPGSIYPKQMYFITSSWFPVTSESRSSSFCYRIVVRETENRQLLHSFSFLSTRSKPATLQGQLAATFSPGAGLRTRPGRSQLRGSSRQFVFNSTAEAALRGSSALVPVGSASELSHKRTEPPLSCRAFGTHGRALNAPGDNLPIHYVPSPRRY